MGTKGQYVTIDLVREQAKDILDFGEVISKYQIADIAFGLITKFGDPSMLITRVTDGVNGPQPIDVINHKGLLPLDLVEIINHTVRDYDTKIKLIPSKNPFFLSDMDDEDLDISSEGQVGESVTQDEDGDTSSSDYYSSLMVDTTAGGKVHKYIIQDGEIITSLKEGSLELSYKSFPLDTNGYPKIPDEEKLIEAIKWALLERAAIKLWYKGKISERAYNHIESKYLFYKKSASNQLKVNSIPEIEAFKNRFLRFRQDVNLYENDFIDYGYPEDFIKHSS